MSVRRIEGFFDLYVLQNLRYTGKGVNLTQVVLVGLIAGAIGGASSTLYHFILDYTIEAIWKYLFLALEKTGLFEHLPEYNFIWMGSLIYITLLVLFLKFFAKYPPGGFGVGVEKLHKDGNVPPSFYLPMLFASLMSLSSGAGVGPEAPVMVLGGASASWVAGYLKLPKRALRLFVLSGICGAHSAFFGSPLTGIFGLESVHLLGLEYFEAFTPGVIASMVGGTLLTLIYQRPYGALFEFQGALTEVTPLMGLQAILLGFAGGLIAFYFFALGKLYAKISTKLDLARIQPFLPFFAWIVFSVAGMLLPPVLFWGEPELRNVISLNELPLAHYHGHSSGILNLGERYSLWTVLAIGLTKVTVLPFNIAMNMRGGIVFPLFHIGGTFGQFISMLTGLDQALAVCCVMAATQGAITRTPFSSALVAVFNSKGTCPQLIIPAAIASYVATLLNYHFSVFPTQKSRDDYDWVDEKAKKTEAIPLSAKGKKKDSELGESSARGLLSEVDEDDDFPTTSTDKPVDLNILTE